MQKKVLKNINNLEDLCSYSLAVFPLIVYSMDMARKRKEEKKNTKLITYFFVLPNCIFGCNHFHHYFIFHQHSILFMYIIFPFGFLVCSTFLCSFFCWFHKCFSSRLAHSTFLPKKRLFA